MQVGPVDCVIVIADSYVVNESHWHLWWHVDLDYFLVFVKVKTSSIVSKVVAIVKYS